MLGQKQSILMEVFEEHLSEAIRIFERNAQKDGLLITYSRYIVRAQL